LRRRIVMTLLEASTDPAPPAASGCSHGSALANRGLDYRQLAGRRACDAEIEDDVAFDRHVFASVLSAADLDGAAAAERAGLAEADFAALMRQWFPRSLTIFAAWGPHPALPEDEEVAMVYDLLIANRSTPGDASRWLAAMIARRSMEPNHLWEDLGLRERSELTRLLTRHFAPLAQRNTRNMRWKRFFYRMLCEDDGLVMCTTPVCTQCRDFDLCFGDEDAESRMANRRREAALQMADAAT
jgi:nitrogen fixation protein NifQ